MPLPRPIGTNRPMHERAPLQIAAALAAVLESFAKTTGQQAFDVQNHPELVSELNRAGLEIMKAVTPGGQK